MKKGVCHTDWSLSSQDTKTLPRKTNPVTTSLFDNHIKDAKGRPKQYEIWYTSELPAHTTNSNFICDISVNANLDDKHTAHCLRATAFQDMKNVGFEARHTMFMSGHKSKASIRSYNRSCSNHQKKKEKKIAAAGWHLYWKGNPALIKVNIIETSTFVRATSNLLAFCNSFNEFHLLNVTICDTV